MNQRNFWLFLIMILITLKVKNASVTFVVSLIHKLLRIMLLFTGGTASGFFTIEDMVRIFESYQL